MFWLHTLSTLQRNIIPDDTYGRWLNLNFYSIFNSNFIQYTCLVLFYCINLPAVFVLTLLSIITSRSVVLFCTLCSCFASCIRDYYWCFWFACFYAFTLYILPTISTPYWGFSPLVRIYWMCITKNNSGIYVQDIYYCRVSETTENNRH